MMITEEEDNDKDKDKEKEETKEDRVCEYANSRLYFNGRNRRRKRRKMKRSS